MDQVTMEQKLHGGLTYTVHYIVCVAHDAWHSINMTPDEANAAEIVDKLGAAIDAAITDAA